MTSLITPNNIKFYYTYREDRKDISNIFHTMGEYIAAYEVIEKAIIKNLYINTETGLSIESIEISSLSAFINSALNLLSPASILEDVSGDGDSAETFKNITNKANEKLRDECLTSSHFQEAVNDGIIKKNIAEDFLNGNIDAISDIDIAIAGQHISKANKKYIREDESFYIFTGTHGVGNKIDTTFLMNKPLSRIFNGFQKNVKDSIEYYDVICPVHIGTGKWKIKSRNECKYVFDTDIKHYEWLEKFKHDSRKIIALKVEISYEVWIVNGKAEIKKPIITKVFDQWWAEKNNECL